jgi:hypothetical protein
MSSEGNVTVFVPDFTRRDVRAATTPAALARGQELAVHVADLNWDEYSLWGSLPGEGSGWGNCWSTTRVGR